MHWLVVEEPEACLLNRVTLLIRNSTDPLRITTDNYKSHAQNLAGVKKTVALYSTKLGLKFPARVETLLSKSPEYRKFSHAIFNSLSVLKAFNQSK